uniref:Uncharacterized protein n=1 Tax=Zea mays TaxID=4577 RepID=C4J4P1_MAIZE|nr:unknown [Zea mays]
MVVGHHLSKHSGHGGVQPEPFHDDSVEVLEPCDDLLADLVGVDTHGGVDLLTERALHVGPLHQVGHDPLQQRGSGLRASAKELGAETHELTVSEPALPLPTLAAAAA